mgnify:CR=1 FL=1
MTSGNRAENASGSRPENTNGRPAADLSVLSRQAERLIEETVGPAAPMADTPASANGPASGPPLGLRQRAEQASATQQLHASLAPMIQSAATAAASGAASAAAVAAASEIERRIAPVLEDLEAMRQQLASERATLAQLLTQAQATLSEGTAAARGAVAEQAKTTSALRQLSGETTEGLRRLLREYAGVADRLTPTSWGWNGTAAVSGFLGGLLAIGFLLGTERAATWWWGREDRQAHEVQAAQQAVQAAIADSIRQDSLARAAAAKGSKKSRRGSGASSTR